MNRILSSAADRGLWLLGFVSFVLTALAILGFWYWVEFAQAVFLIALPMSFVGVLSDRTARSDRRARRRAARRCCGQLLRHRLWTQVIGMVAIFVTAMCGMYQNLYVGPFGH